MSAEGQVFLDFLEFGEGNDGNRIHLAVGNTGLKGRIDFGPGDGGGLSTHGRDDGFVGVKSHGPDLHAGHVGRGMDGAFGVGQMEKPAGIAEPQNMKAGFLFDVSSQFFPEGAVEHLIGFADVGKGKGNVQDADQRIRRCKSTHRMDACLDDTGLDLLQDILVLAQLSAGEGLNHDGAVGAGFDEALEYRGHGAGGVVKGIVLVQVVQFDGFCRNGCTCDAYDGEQGCHENQ